MKIVGINETTNTISFFHKNKNLKFQQIVPPNYKTLFSDDYLVETVETKFVFDDLCEVDVLISMLKRFKTECSEHFNNWHSEHYAKGEK